jgi:hypothetical protein
MFFSLDNLRLEIRQKSVGKSGGYTQKYFFYKIFDEIFEGFGFAELKVLAKQSTKSFITCG